MPLKENEDAPIVPIESNHKHQLKKHLAQLRLTRGLLDGQIEMAKHDIATLEKQAKDLDKIIKMLEHIEWLCML